MSPRDEDVDPDEDAEEADDSEDSREPVALPIEDTLDLHTFPPREIADLVTTWIAEAQSAGFREVRIIHGRGIGVQREIVRSLLAADPRVESFADAPPTAGGWGATQVVLLAKKGTG